MKRIVLLFVVISNTCLSQAIDYYEHLFFKQNRRFAFEFDNDFFLATDRYYSQGLALSYKTPVLYKGHWMNNFFLYKPGRKMFGASIEQMGFTPTTIAYDSLLAGNRPYAGTLRTNLTFESVDSARNFALSWTLSCGVIGKEAYAKNVQDAVHRWTNNPHPKGWHHQIRTGLLLDANIYSHQQIAKAGSWLILVAEESASFGTSRIDLTIGPRMQFQWLTKNRNFHFAVFANPAVKIVGYNGTLQGSLIGQKSEYVISRADINPLILEREFGAMVRYKRIQMNGYVNINSPNFRNALKERWGSIKLTYFFK